MPNKGYSPKELIYLWVTSFVFLFLFVFIQTVNEKYGKYTLEIWGWLIFIFAPVLIFLSIIISKNKLIVNRITSFLLSGTYFFILFSFLILQPILVNSSDLSLIQLFRLSLLPFLLFQGVIIFVLNLKANEVTEGNRLEQKFPLEEKSRIIKLIQENRIEDVLESLYDYFKEADSSELKKDIIHLTKKWKDNSRKKSLNLVSEDFAERVEANIVDSILNIIK